MISKLGFYSGTLMPKLSSRVRSPLVIILRALCYILVYQILSITINVPAIPSILDLIASIGIVLSMEMSNDWIATIGRWLLVFLISSALGSVTGALLAYKVEIAKMTAFDLDFWRSLPATALVTFFFALGGDNEVTRALPAGYITFFTVIYFTTKAGANLPRVRVDHLSALGASSWFVFRESFLFELFPTIAVACRQALSLSFLVLISTELIVGSGGDVGLGNRLIDWFFYGRFAPALTLILTLGLIGYLANLLAGRLIEASPFLKPR